MSDRVIRLHECARADATPAVAPTPERIKKFLQQHPPSLPEADPRGWREWPPALIVQELPSRVEGNLPTHILREYGALATPKRRAAAVLRLRDETLRGHWPNEALVGYRIDIDPARVVEIVHEIVADAASRFFAERPEAPAA